MPQTLRPCPVSAAQFTWCPEERMFVAEASTFGRGLGRVYADACDEGLTLVSRYPGRSDVVFVVERIESRDGDALWWDLVPVNGDPGFTVRIFND
jgi:hypothetical protein